MTRDEIIAQAKKPKVLVLNKMINGVKTPWYLEIGPEQIIVGEGIFKDVKPDKGMIFRPPREELKYDNTHKESFKQFFDLEMECPDIKGWKELRVKYKEELEALGEECTGCSLNSLNKQYWQRLRDLIKKDE